MKEYLCPQCDCSMEMRANFTQQQLEADCISADCEFWAREHLPPVVAVQRIDEFYKRVLGPIKNVAGFYQHYRGNEKTGGIADPRRE